MVYERIIDSKLLGKFLLGRFPTCANFEYACPTCMGGVTLQTGGGGSRPHSFF